MAYDPRTGITTYDELDPAADPTADLAAEIPPSTATALAPVPAQPPVPDPALNWLDEMLRTGRQIEATDVSAGGFAPDYRSPEHLLFGTYGLEAGGQLGVSLKDLLGQIATAADQPGFDWTPALARAAQSHMGQYNTAYTLDSPLEAVLLGVIANSGDPRMMQVWEQVAPEVTPALQALRAQLMEQREQQKKAQRIKRLSTLSGPVAAFAGPVVAGMFGGAGGAAAGTALAEELAALGIAQTGGAAAGGMLGTLAAGAAQGGISGLATGDPLKGAAKGLLSAGVSNYVQPLLQTGMQSVFDSFNPDIDFAAFEEDTRRATGGMFDSALPMPQELFADALPTTGSFDDILAADTLRAGMEMGALPGGETLAPTFLESAGFQMPDDGLLDELPSLRSVFGAEAPQFAIPEFGQIEPAPAPAEPQPSPLDRAARLAKMGAQLSKIFAGQGTPDGAPQRVEGQSDAEYAQSLASYVNVDAQALADMGLVPGTPEYYDYLMTQLDATIEAMSGTVNVDAADLEQQLRGKTREELDALRRALFVRGQLDQLMGAGAYTDPFTGRTEEVITNGRRVNPGVAAYHRGLGRTIEEFAGMSPMERERAIGGFLERDADLYGMQARADTQAEQAAQFQAYLEDLKRRRGMFSQSQALPQFSLGTTGDPELDQLLGLFAQ